MKRPYQLIEGSAEEYLALLEEGESLFRQIQPDLNVLAEKYTYTKHGVRTQVTYEEICLALAIFANKKKVSNFLIRQRKNFDIQ